MPAFSFSSSYKTESNLTISSSFAFRSSCIYFDVFLPSYGILYAVLQYDPGIYTLTMQLKMRRSGLGLQYVRDEEDNPYIFLYDADNNKVDRMENIYQAGSLRIEKHQSGGNDSDTFKVNVKLTAPEGKKVNSVIKVKSENAPGTAIETIAPEEWKDVSTSCTLDVVDGTVYTLTNIPAGVSYEVSEEPLDDYDVAYQKKVNDKSENSNTGTIETSEDVVISIANTGNTTVNTSASMTGIPYMGLLAMSLTAAILFVLKLKWQL